MKKIITLANLFAIAATFAQAGAPAAPYYNNFNWNQTGSSLKNALTTKITNTHTKSLNYTSPQPSVWNAIKNTDVDPNNSNNVLLVYGWENGSDSDVTNDRSRNKNNNGGNSGEWNREHVYAQSVGTPDLGQSGPGADAHHLRASDVQRNNSRGNRLFTTGSGNSGAVGLYWYPGDEWKGDVARMMMYMYLRYGNQCLPTAIGTGSTVASDANMLTLFLQWNAEDPVSPYEDYRNTYLGNASNTYGQGNRNPFIDNPFLATVIWGGPVAENRWPNVFLSTEDFEALANVIVYPNPSNNQRINIQSQVVLDEIQLINLNGQLVQQIKKPVAQDNNYSLTDLPQGFYLLRLSSEHQTVTKKVIVN